MNQKATKKKIPNKYFLIKTSKARFLLNIPFTGVGRTGTLVALDSMMQQLNEEGQVSVFNTICDLRHQRNFLVQSLVSFPFTGKSKKFILQNFAFHFRNNTFSYTELCWTSLFLEIQKFSTKVLAQVLKI